MYRECWTKKDKSLVERIENGDQQKLNLQTSKKLAKILEEQISMYMDL